VIEVGDPVPELAELEGLYAELPAGRIKKIEAEVRKARRPVAFRRQLIEQALVHRIARLEAEEAGREPPALGLEINERVLLNNARNAPEID
jgi:hypothetical protein